MSEPILECVPNFSTAEPVVVDALTEAAGPRVLLDRTADLDHNRSVLTLAGDPESVEQALFRTAEVAVASIDLRVHRGVHPRMGAIDVAPFIGVRGLATAELVRRAHAFATRLWDTLGVPAYFYGEAASAEEREPLEIVRKGGFEALVADQGRTRKPDVGGPAPHPSAGATAVGVRPFLIAFNVNLATRDIKVARRIARAIRTSSGGYPAVKALGLELPSLGVTQVSMNLTDFTCTPPRTVFERVSEEARRDGVAVIESELIGLIPAAALTGTSGEALRIRGFDAERMVLERVMESARNRNEAIRPQEGPAS